MRVLLAAASPLVAALLWVAALLIDPGRLAPRSVLMMGWGLLTMATIAIVGMIVVGGRWALRTAFATVIATLLIALLRPVDPIWFVALTGSIGAGVLLFLPIVTARIRKLPSATGPPTGAVLVPLLLAATPFSLGLAAWDHPTGATLIVAFGASLAALWYSRVLPGGLYAVRLGWPLLALGLAPLQSLPAATVSVVTALLVLVIAWHREVRIAFHPPRESGRVFPIPPVLAPQEILDAAEIDERGRPR
ncbi:MAG: hypothetical protein M3P87_12375 [Actinomycetota bacterium]|nr:hypothetical protein [Actinomycetota bacterium]